MTIEEKISETLSHAIAGEIVLYSEGMFWKAYQEAAYLFVTHIRQYQINKIYVKKVGLDVFSLGFPKPAATKVLAGFSYIETDDRILVRLNESVFDQGMYCTWRDTVTVQNLPKKSPSGETLLVYKHAYDLLLHFYQINRNVEREYKFTLSEKIKDELQEAMLYIYFANEQKDHSDRLASIRSAIRMLISVKIKVRLLHDLRQLSVKQFASLAEKEVDLLAELRQWEVNICSR